MNLKKISAFTMSVALTFVLGVIPAFTASADSVSVNANTSNIKISDTASANSNVYSVDKSAINANVKSGDTEFITANGKTFIDKIPAVTVNNSKIVSKSNSANDAPTALEVSNYQYSRYGSLPTALSATATYEGYTYTGTLYLTTFTYYPATDLYVGLYSGTLSR